MSTKPKVTTQINKPGDVNTNIRGCIFYSWAGNPTNRHKKYYQ